MPDTTLVRDVMTPKVVTLRADQAIGDAADEMAAHKYGAMPVVDGAGKLLGLLRDEDFIVSEARVHVPTYISLLGVSVPLPADAHLDEELRKVAGSTVGEVMEEHPLTITAGRHARRPRDGDARNGGVARPGRRRERDAGRHRRPRRHRAVHRPDDVTAHRPVWAEVDLGAVARQRARAARRGARRPTVLAVVKADGYGHGAVPVGRAALEAGASSLGVALVEEGVELRDAGIDAPILVLSEPVPEAAETVVAAPAHAGRVHRAAASTRWPRRSPRAATPSRSTCTSRSTPACTASGAAPTTRSSSRAQVVARTRSCGSRACARTSPSPTSPRTRTPPSSTQRFDAVLDALRARRDRSRRRARVQHRRARSRCPPRATTWCASASASTASRPRRALEGRVALRPALSVKARVSHVKDVPAGARASRTACATRPTARRASRPCRSATPTACRAELGRGPAARCSSAGVRCPIAGTVTMDQLMLDVGDVPVEVGDEVVLIGRAGRRGDHRGRVGRARRHDRVQIVCGIGPRVPRRYIG